MKDMINKVFNEDCLETIKRIDDNCVDLVLTDVPFGMEFQSGYRETKHKKIVNDDNLNWLPEWIKEIDRISKKEAHLYIFCSHHKVEIFKQEIQKYRKVKNILIWEKNNTGMGDLYGDYAPKYEMVLFCSNGEKKLNDSRDSNIIKATRTQNELHPTQKPIDLMEYFIRKSSKENDLVLDTFMGSGTTAVACKNMNRNFIGSELDKEYYNTIQKRLSQTQGSLF